MVEACYVSKAVRNTQVLGLGKVVNFEMDPFRKQCLLEGLDDIGQTLQRKGKIDGFEERQKAGQPWLYGEAAE